MVHFLLDALQLGDLVEEGADVLEDSVGEIGVDENGRVEAGHVDVALLAGLSQLFRLLRRDRGVSS